MNNYNKFDFNAKPILNCCQQYITNANVFEFIDITEDLTEISTLINNAEMEAVAITNPYLFEFFLDLYKHSYSRFPLSGLTYFKYYLRYLLYKIQVNENDTKDHFESSVNYIGSKILKTVISFTFYTTIFYKMDVALSFLKPNVCDVSKEVVKYFKSGLFHNIILIMEDFWYIPVFDKDSKSLEMQKLREIRMLSKKLPSSEYDDAVKVILGPEILNDLAIPDQNEHTPIEPEVKNSTLIDISNTVGISVSNDVSTMKYNHYYKNVDRERNTSADKNESSKSIRSKDFDQIQIVNTVVPSLCINEDFKSPEKLAPKDFKRYIKPKSNDNTVVVNNKVKSVWYTDEDNEPINDAIVSVKRQTKVNELFESYQDSFDAKDEDVKIDQSNQDCFRTPKSISMIGSKRRRIDKVFEPNHRPVQSLDESCVNLSNLENLNSKKLSENSLELDFASPFSSRDRSSSNIGSPVSAHNTAFICDRSVYENTVKNGPILCSPFKRKIGPMKPLIEPIEKFTEWLNGTQKDDTRANESLSCINMTFSEKPVLPTFGPYKCLNLIGSGSYSKVYEAKKDNGYQKFAVKVLKFDRTQPKEAVMNELYIMKKMSVTGKSILLLDSHVSVKGAIIIMEKALTDMKKFYSDNSKTVDKIFIMHYWGSMMKCVNTLHGLNIAHMDLKLQNFVVTESLHVKLIDFGISKNIPKGETITIADSVGTIVFMSPELLENETVIMPYKCDIWSMGVVLYSMIFNCLPVDADTFEEYIEKITVPNFVFPYPECARNCTILSKIMFLCLHRSPSDRASAETILYELNCVD